MSTDAVFEKLGVDLVEVKEFNCCGYPLKNFDFNTHALLSAKNLSLAEKNQLDITTLCNCCYGSLTHVDHLMKEDAGFRNEMNEKLEKEGLRYDGNVRVRHLLEILYEDIGLEQISSQLTSRFNNLRVAVHYGCHLIRPDKVVRFETRSAADIFDELVEVLGAESVAWTKKQECCGAPIWGINDELSMDLTQRKIMDAIQSEANCLCVACPFCQLQFDRVQNTFLGKRDAEHQLPSVIYTQLLGLCLGIDADRLGLGQSELDTSSITNFSAVSQ